MPSPTAPSSPGRSPGWFANRPLAVKFGILVAVLVLAFAGLLTAVLIGDAQKETASAQLADLNTAQALVLQIDTRASELKVDGYKALVRPVPAEELEELAGDSATAQGLIDELNQTPLTGRARRRWRRWRRASASTPTRSRCSPTRRWPTRSAPGRFGRTSRRRTT